MYNMNILKKIILATILFTSTVVYAETVNTTNFVSQGSTPISAGDFGLRFVANNNTSIVSVSKASETAVSTVRILNESYVTLDSATFVGDIATFTNPISVNAGSNYYVTINNGSSGFTTNYGSVAQTLPANNADISFPSSGNAVFHTPYNPTITGFSVGESSLGITSIITSTTQSTTTSTTTATTTPPQTINPIIVYAGDSLTEAIAVPHPYNYFLTVPTEYSQHNIGVSGKYMSAINTEASSYVDTLWVNSSTKVVIIWAGINDFWGGKNAQETYDSLRTFCLHERSLGAKVIVLTTISHTGGNPLYSDTTRNQYNDLIRNNWNTFADGLADVALNQNIGLDNSYQSTTYFADGAHLTQIGYQIVADIVQPVLNNVLGVTQVTPSYSLTQAQFDRLNVLISEMQSILNSAIVN